MIIAWSVPRAVRFAIGPALLAALILLATIGPARAGAAPSAARQEAPPADAEIFRAYDRPAPAPARFHTVDLTVLDDETGRPLGDVEIRIVNSVDARFHTSRTDAQGRLRFEYPSVRGQFSVNIELRKDGYVPLRSWWGSEDGAKPPNQRTFRLRRGTTMGGIVVAAADRPIEGATVVMTVVKLGPGKRPDNPTGQEIYWEIPSRTGRDGRWRTDSVPPGAKAVRLQLIHPDFVCDDGATLGSRGRTPRIQPLRDRTDRQVLLKGMRIDGRVLDDRGRPIAGARVADGTQGLTSLEYGWRADTDAEGRFHIHLPRGKSVKLTVQARGYQPATQEVAADPDHPTVEFRLPPGKRLRGRVIDPRGRPIAGAQLNIPSIPVHKGIFFNQFTDDQGCFEWDSAPAEPVVFQIGAAGYLLSDPDPFVQLTASDQEAVVVLKPAVRIRLEVLDAATGRPIPTYVIRIGTTRPGAKEIAWGEPMVVSAPDPFARSLEAEKGPYHFKITANGYAPAQVRIPGEQTSLREVVKLEKVSK